MESARRPIDEYLWGQLVKSLLEQGANKDLITAILHGHRIHKKASGSTDKNASFKSINQFRGEFLKEYSLGLSKI